MAVLSTLSVLPPTLDVAPKLKLLQMIGSGINHLHASPFWHSSPVPIANSSGVAATTIAEYIITTMLAAGRILPQMLAWQHASHWGPSAHATGTGASRMASFNGVKNVVGQRMGILGYGAIGRQTARLAKALGMDVVACTASPRPTPESRKDHVFCVPETGDPDGALPSQWFAGTDRANVRNFLAQDLDVLVISMPLTKQTRALIGREELEILGKRNAFLVNISRGPIIDTEALIEALKRYEQDGGKGPERGGLRGAALDVTDPEPLPDGHPLWTAPNIIITPHISSLNDAYMERVLMVLDQNLERFEKGEKFINLVDREKGYTAFHQDEIREGDKS